ncbi:MAG TPA: FGGY family carbohydrate kinase, partial [Microterricola sp.]
MSGTVAAVDLGATSGRVIVAKVGQNELDMRTVTRFANTPVQTIDGLHWNVLELYRSALAGLGTALREEPELSSIGIDSWAVDYALMRGERMLGTPFHYRDERTARGVEAAHALVPPAELYARNGLQFLPFNSLYQLTTDRIDGVLELADGALLIPDLFTFWLTGRRVAERSNASTTGLLSVKTGQWDAELMARLKLPASVLPPLVDAGARIASLLPAVATELGATRPIDVIAVGSHDTASAVLAVPMRAESAAYISCGTWGLVGLELERPVLSEAAREANFTNEGGVDGTVRFLHNVMG